MPDISIASTDLHLSTNVPAISTFLADNDQLAILYNPEQLAIKVRTLENKIKLHEDKASALYIADRGCYFKVAEQKQKAQAWEHHGRASAYKEELEELFAGLSLKQQIEVEQATAKLLIQSAKDTINERYEQRVAQRKLAAGPTVLDMDQVRIKK